MLMELGGRKRAVFRERVLEALVSVSFIRKFEGKDRKGVEVFGDVRCVELAEKRTWACCVIGVSGGMLMVYWFRPQEQPPVRGLEWLIVNCALPLLCLWLL